MAKVVAVANQKGGVGKTTTAINLSACIAYRGKRVMIVDNDPQANTTSGLGINKREIEQTIYDVIIRNASIKNILTKTKIENLDLCPSNIELAGAEIELVPMMSRETRLKDAIEQIKIEYDYIIIDCPPSLGLLTINSLTAADTVLVPIQCEYYALEGIGQLMDTIKLVQKHLNPSLAVEGILLTMYDPRTNLSVQVLEEVEKFFKKKVYKTVIPRNVRLSEAPSFGLPIILYDSKSKGAECYMNLADEFMSLQEG